MSAPAAERDAATPLVFLVAGEPSGDVLGARLMAALTRFAGGRVRFAGIGGERMAAEGLRTLFPVDDLAVMGFAEVLPRLVTIFRRMREVEAAIRTARPAVVVTIDSPGFNMRLARRIRPFGIPMVHYVAPQLWAWKPERARKLVGLFDRILALFAFEQPFFARLGIDTVTVGHPAIEAPAPVAGDLRARLAIASEAPVLALLPGSRRGLVQRMLPVYAETAHALARRFPGLVVVLPVVPGTRALVEAAVARWSVPTRVIADLADKRAALAVAHAAITTSGTATLELALAGLPIVVAYRASALSAMLVRRMVTVRHVSLPNLILEREVVPELLQDACTADRLGDAAGALLDGGAAAVAQRAAFADLRARLGGDGPPPSERAARAVLDVLRAR
jgi:lipid-A-disaccharide synthase